MLPFGDVLLQNVLINSSRPADLDSFFHEALNSQKSIRQPSSGNRFYVLFGFLAQKVIAGAMRPSVESVETSTMMPPAMYLSMLGLAIRYRKAPRRRRMKTTLTIGSIRVISGDEGMAV